ncbi:uncharacterized protein Pyn_39125 [Prunus yedoensis var. nudiflora]|uniref:Uncharacterized protein n=1 Tax=Prunus yedoensis var. nudiflora TaxID=2094558 RepID=A0A314UP49_PRUYE|nr:uncharacterized protein Pyn_39125 [Prunus yedoensis var. nudiflora]
MASSTANATEGDFDGSLEYAPQFPRSPPPPLPFPTSSGSEGDSDDPVLEIDDMRNKLAHNSSMVHYWTEKCVAAERKLEDLTRQVNNANYKREKHRIRAQRRKFKVEDLHMSEEDAKYETTTIHKRGDKHRQAIRGAFNEGFEKFRRITADAHRDIDWDAVTVSAAQEFICGGVDPTQHSH